MRLFWNGKGWREEKVRAPLHIEVNDDISITVAEIDDGEGGVRVTVEENHHRNGNLIKRRIKRAPGAGWSWIFKTNG